MRDLGEYAENYQDDVCEKYQVFYRKKKILELMEKKENLSILEIGCGMDPLFTHLSNFKNMVIVEPSEFFLKNAKKMTANASVLFVQGFLEEKIEEIQETNIDFDYIIVSSLLHEVENPKILVNAVRKICGKETIIHFNVPNARSIHRVLAESMGIIKDIHELSKRAVTLQQREVFDMDKLVTFLTLNGFDIIQKGSYFPKFLSSTQMEKALLEGIISPAIFEGLYVISDYFPENGSELYVEAKMKY